MAPACDDMTIMFHNLGDSDDILLTIINFYGKFDEISATVSIWCNGIYENVMY